MLRFSSGLPCSDDGNQENSTDPELQDALIDAQARKVAAQAVIELTDRLANAEQENSALRLRLREARKLSKVCSCLYEEASHNCYREAASSRNAFMLERHASAQCVQHGML